MVNILLSSRYAMWMLWGPRSDDAVQRFLPAHAGDQTSLGPRHFCESRLGGDLADIGPRIESVLTTGTATYDEGLLLLLERSGFPEETYHTFSYSPLVDDDGRINGMLCVVTEETERVIGERRVETLRSVASALASTNTEDEVMRAVGSQLSLNGHDLPFTLTYIFDETGTARLATSSGIRAAHPLAPELIGRTAHWPWPADQVYRHVAPRFIVDLGQPQQDAALQAKATEIPGGVWNKPASRAAVVPIKQQGQEQPAGFLVVGTNPYRHYDESYSGFIDLPRWSDLGGTC